MNVHEFQAAEILADRGIPVNRGMVATSPEEAADIAEQAGGGVAVKAQVHSGGRGKAGGIKLAESPEETTAAASTILGMDIRGHTVHQVLIAPKVDIDREFYLGVVLDRPRRQIVVMASAEGGVEIEQVAQESPEKIITEHGDSYLGLHPYQARKIAFGLGLSGKQVNAFASITLKLFEAFTDLDATLAEINPLILTGDGELMALDSKMSFDDNAIARHPAIEALRDLREEDETELEAKQSGISYVKLDGSIGCIVNGAGLAMATMDAVKLNGGEPANFLDVGGGASAEQVAKAFRLVTGDPNVKAILVNIFGGITRGDVVANGIQEALGQVDVHVPIVIRLAGTNSEEGRRILEASGLRSFETMDEAAAQVVTEAGG